MFLKLPKISETPKEFPKMFQCETKEPVHIFHFGTAHQTICEKSGNMNVEFTEVTLGHKFNMTFDHKGCLLFSI